MMHQRMYRPVRDAISKSGPRARAAIAPLSGYDRAPRELGVEDDAQDLIDSILEWAESKDFFDTGFVEEMQERLDERGSLSSG